MICPERPAENAPYATHAPSRSAQSVPAFLPPRFVRQLVPIEVSQFLEFFQYRRLDDLQTSVAGPLLQSSPTRRGRRQVDGNIDPAGSAPQQPKNAFQAFMVPATAGFLSALIIFGIAMVYFVAPSTLRADNDVPLVLVNTAPELQQSAFGMTLDTIEADSLVIEAYVDANGRVQDYRILSDTEKSKEVLPQVKRMLIFTTFRPALSMGRPTASRAVLSFSKISVRG